MYYQLYSCSNILGKKRVIVGKKIKTKKSYLRQAIISSRQIIRNTSFNDSCKSDTNIRIGQVSVITNIKH